jgi:hypothetical protein
MVKDAGAMMESSKNDAQQRILRHTAGNKYPAQFAQAGWKPALLSVHRTSASSAGVSTPR